jgi:SAM-dependent methyltransferase/pyruvate-formate lyase-activating enzyme
VSRTWLLMKLSTGQFCNEKCVFCHAVEHKGQIRTPEALRRVDQAARGRFSGILFSGGEPTIRKDIAALVSRTAELGMEAGFITNGRMLSYRKYARDLRERGLTECHVSLHGGTPEIHDYMVGVSGAWAQTTAAIRNLLELGVRVNTNFVVCRENMRDLPRYLSLLRKLPLYRLRVSLAFPKGRAKEDLSVLPDLQEVCAFVSEVAAQHGDLPHLHFDGFPGCLMPWSMPSYELLECDIVAMQEVWEPDRWYPCDQGSARHVAACRGCANETLCAGIHDAYLLQTPTSPLRPASRFVSNAFDYRLEAAEPVSPRASCPMPDTLRARLHPLRDVVVRTGDTLRAAHTDTGDFSLLEIRNTVHNRGQLYLQVGEQAFIDDFARELRLLEPSASCATCERALACPGVWAPSPRDVLGDALARLRARLAQLEGDVLDVGRGPGRLDDVFADRGEGIRYHGFDPDAAAIEEARAAHPEWRLEAHGVEDLDVPDESYDTILVLFAHNHFRHIVPAYRRLVAALRPGGRLIVCDNPPFALVREGHLIDAVRSAEGAHPPDHFHNDYSEWVRPELEALGLVTLEERPVVAGGPNEWYLEFEKPRAEVRPDEAPPLRRERAVAPGAGAYSGA